MIKNWINNVSRGLITVSIIAVFFTGCRHSPKNGEWGVYGGSPSRSQYSALSQIDTINVFDLQIAWIYQTNDGEPSGQIQTNPLIVDNILYGVSPKLKLFALDAATGEEKWVFDPMETMLIDNAGKQNYGLNVCRGIAMYKVSRSEYYIYYTVGSSLYCISSINGHPVQTFGKGGRISLHENLETNRDIKHLRVTSTSPGIIYKDLIILGSSLSEEEESAPGHIRAYDVYTGERKWIFKTIPGPDDVGYESWNDPEAYKYVGGANAWGGFSLDEKRGIVYAATGSATPDFYGGNRKGDNLFANSIIALDAATGAYKWHFQTIHHDLWDWDLPTAPVLTSIMKDGILIDVAVQVGKNGFIYMLDRDTGTPIHPIVEQAVPTSSDLTGEALSPTQPIPTVLPPFVRQKFTEDDLNPYIPDSSYQDIKQRFKSYVNEGIFTPPSKKGTLVFPGLTGGAEWGGPSIDPETGILYINATELPWVITMTDDDEEHQHVSSNQTHLVAGKALYQQNCQGCHGQDLRGSGNFPSLVGVAERFTKDEFTGLLSSGLRMMPAFNNLTEQEKDAIASYLLDLVDLRKKPFQHEKKTTHPFYQSPYRFAGYKQFLTPEGYPAVSPPWGTLSAIDLSSGGLVWTQPLGDYPELKAKGIHAGTENWGGSVVTAGGLVFIAATRDEKFRAFNKTNGKLLIELDLPAGGYATPAVYSVNNKQYIVIACGGGKMRTKSSDVYVAFALP